MSRSFLKLHRHTKAAIWACLAGFAFQSVAVAASLAYESGHADLGVRYEAGQFASYLRLSNAMLDGQLVADAELEPDEVHVVVPSAAMRVLPVDVPFLGVLAGSPVWILPASQAADMPYLGWSTEALDPTDWIGNVTYTLSRAANAAGTGDFAMWRFDAFGQVSQIHASTAQPGSAGGLSLVPGIHDHLNLAFSAPGIWEVQLHVSGQHVTDGAVSATLPAWRFHVIPEPSALLLVLPSMVCICCRRRRD